MKNLNKYLLAKQKGNCGWGNKFNDEVSDGFYKKYDKYPYLAGVYSAMLDDLIKAVGGEYKALELIDKYQELEKLRNELGCDGPDLEIE